MTEAKWLLRSRNLSVGCRARYVGFNHKAATGKKGWMVVLMCYGRSTVGTDSTSRKSRRQVVGFEEAFLALQ